MAMPPSLQSTWDGLWNEVAVLHSRWKLYKQLFASSEKQIKVLNECAPAFFSAIQYALLDNVQLTLSKLADPAKMGVNKNATLERLLNEITSLNLHGLTPRLQKYFHEYQDKCLKVKERRNKQIAHFDLAALVSPLPGPSRQEIEEALAVLREFMNDIDQHFHDSTTAYENLILRGNADSLVAVLKQGLRYQQLVKEGVIPYDDFKKSSESSRD